MPARFEVLEVQGRSTVTALQSEGPLRLLTPEPSGRAAWLVQSNLGGGFVGADDLSLEGRVGPSAHAFLGSQSSSKVYRQARSRFSLKVSVAAGASLVAWADPVVCFEGAALEQRLHFQLEPGASLLVVDACGAGRVARGERWAFERLLTRLDVDVGTTPAFREALELDPAHGDLQQRMGALAAFATVVMVGPAFAALGTRVLEQLADRPLDEPLVVGSKTRHGTILRASATSTEQLHEVVCGLVRGHVAEHLGDDPWSRRF